MQKNYEDYIQYTSVNRNVFVHKDASVGENCEFGFNIVVDADAEIGDNCYIGNNVTIKERTILEDSIEIQDNVVIGKQPRSSPISARKVAKELLVAKIGSGTLIGTGSVIYGGTEKV